MQRFSKVFTLMGAILALAFCLASCKANVDDAPQKTAGSISYATTSVEKTTADEAFTNELTKTGDGTVTYASSKTDVATVNATTGEVTIVATGETVITAMVADSDTYTYATKTANYTLTVTAVGSISYATTTVSKTTTDEAFTNTLNNTGDGTVTYASSKTDVATVNATTGEVTIKGAGETTITATVADSDTYTYATKTASYTLTVTQAATTLADVFHNGSVTTIKFNTFLGAKSATFVNNNGTFSVTSGASHWNDENDHDAGTESGVRTITQDGNSLIIRYGWHDSDAYDTIFTFNKEDNSYSITGDDYFEISDITALEVNGTDIKSTLTKK